MARRGHGELRDLTDEKEFFSEMKGEDKMVVHFYRNNWPCKVMDMHLDMLSKKHLETKFAKIDAEKSPFLTERLKIWMLPTLALISKEKVLDYVVGFDDLGGTDDFPTEHLRLVLASKNMLNYEGDDAESDARRLNAKTTEAVEKKNLRKGGGTSSRERRRDSISATEIEPRVSYENIISPSRRQSEHDLKTRRKPSTMTRDLSPLVPFRLKTWSPWFGSPRRRDRSLPREGTRPGPRRRRCAR